MRIDYPVAIDNDYAVWRAFDNYYWPALYFVDAQGRIRHHHFGEGEYEQSEMVIQQLLAEAGSARRPRTWCRSWTPRRGGPGRLGHLDHRRTTPAMSGPRTSPLPAASCRTSRTLRRPRRGCGSTTGPCPATGRWGDRPPAERGRRPDRLPVPRPRPAPGHGPGGRGPPCGSGCSSTGSHPARPRPRRGRPGQRDGPQQRLYQLIRQRGLSPSAPSRSRSSIPASRPTCSPSARPGWRRGSRPAPAPVRPKIT